MLKTPEQEPHPDTKISQLRKCLEELEEGKQYILFPRENESGLETDQPQFNGDNDNELVIQYLAEDLYKQKDAPEIQSLVTEKRDILERLLEELKRVSSDMKSEYTEKATSMLQEILE